MDAKTINKFPIREYLAARGIRPAKDRVYYGLYHSPLRKDSTPSMKVDYDKNLWIDYGAGEGGTLIDLVMRMDRCDAGEAMRRLEQMSRQDAVACMRRELETEEQGTGN